MNKVILCGRLTRDPRVTYTSGAESVCVARYSLAVDRRTREQQADFISCVAFGRAAEFVEKYLKQGTKIIVSGSLRTGSYTDRDGKKVYTSDVVVEEQEFAESKNATVQDPQKPAPAADENGFMEIPEGTEGDQLPFA